MRSERQAILAVLHSPRFADCSPTEVYATLLDEGVYLASERTFYRLLADQDETHERRDQLVHPAYAKPELLATRPNEVWSWDITKLLGPTKWTYFYLYVILDIFSRYVVGWMIAYQEQAALAERLIAETLAKQEIAAGQLTIHADRGAAMTSKPVAFLLADLGVTKTHSRPHVSNDNPFSEAQFKTLKYRPGFPERFASIEEARSFAQEFFPWYNTAASPRGDWLAHSRSGALRTRERTSRRSGERPECGLRCPSRTLRQPCSGSATDPDGGVHQPAKASSDRGGESVISPEICLRSIDRFRGTRIIHPRPQVIQSRLAIARLPRVLERLGARPLGLGGDTELVSGIRCGDTARAIGDRPGRAQAIHRGGGLEGNRLDRLAGRPVPP